MNMQLLNSSVTKEKIYSHELPFILNEYANKITLLSLDCFDTLLWRTTAKPDDVFFAAQHSEAFRSIGLSAGLRIESEYKARQMRGLKEKITEVTLIDIYKEYCPSLTSDQLLALTNAEMEAEQQVCYSFPPIVELIRAAQGKGIKIIIVSDTYFTENQLRSLLSKALPDDAMNAISKIFCSSEYNKSKLNQLFLDVVKTMKVNSKQILHIGDNLSSDYIAARRLELNALHFIQENDYVSNKERLYSMTANLMDASIRTTQPLYSPFRAIFSTSEGRLDDPAFLIGYYSLGPIMYSFAQYIIEEVKKIRDSRKNTKVLFLMRDAYLPALACEAIEDQSIGYSIAISRFSSYAASFRTVEDVDRYLALMLKTNRFDNIVRQLLLPEKVSAPIIRAVQNIPNAEEEFTRLIHRSDVLRIIFQKSAEYRGRLKKYLEKTIFLSKGDTLIFVDLGYAGTTQQLLTPFFNELGVEVEGRYLIALEASIKETYRKGLLDSKHYDRKTLRTLLHFIALFEKLCTSNEKSVVDYDESGNIICTTIDVKDDQKAKLLAIQNACIKFVKNANNFFKNTSGKFSYPMQRTAALTELARLIYLPTTAELHYLQSFQFDENLGTKDIHQLFDPKKALDGLKRRGMFYIDKNSASKRISYPAELRIAGFELALAFMSQVRFILEPTLDSMALRREAVEARLFSPGQAITVMLGSYATHDGYYALWVEAGKGVSLSIGKRYQWIQIQSAELIKEAAFRDQSEAGHSIDAMSYLKFNGMQDHGNSLMQCLSKEAIIEMTPDASIGHTGHIFRLVYRPIVYGT